MASSIAQRRALREARRKKSLVARRAGLAMSLAQKAALAATWPLHACFLHGGIADYGMCNVIVARRSPLGPLAMAAFLVDPLALGIKDVVFNMIEPAEFATFVKDAGGAAPLRPVEPSYARKLVRDAAAYAASIGFRPHRGFVAIERIFGDARAEDCPDEFVFGQGGRPYYISGPTETAGQIGRRLGTLADQLGRDGFDFLIPLADDECLTNDGIVPIPADPRRAASTSDG